MKKSLAVLVLITSILSLAFAQAAAEENRNTVNLAVMQGPTGFSSAGLPSFVEVSVFPSPTEAVAKLANGELDMAALPANAAVNLFNKGVGIKAVAIVGEGMLSVLGTDENSKTIAVPGAGGTPDHMASLLYPSYEADYSVSAPAQVAQMLIAGKIPLAILPEPFVTMVTKQNSQVKVISNVQEKWEGLTKEEQYPMSILVVSAKFAQEHPALLYQAAEAYKESVEWVNQNHTEAGQRIEEIGIMKAAMATAAIGNCALVFKTGEEAKNEINAYCKILMELAPQAIDNAVPKDGFYL